MLHFRMWEHRNDALHGAKPTPTQLSHLSTLRQEILKEYSKGDATLPPTDRWRLDLDYREINLNLSLPKTLRWLETIKLARAAHGRLRTTYQRRTQQQLQRSMHTYLQTGRTTTNE
ncbi:expressed unknown protein [Seminavis robusta]|uniref:Uncharacterized protein n=1 Tax=Seminavis robusta TaxID=568900 RepID=A0A9N8DIG7_9STRA|nr:expressed unknown protein [Seminavis robusta]|eukprot:Sro138_g064901.1  (116) ;mRNA; r:108971-109318